MHFKTFLFSERSGKQNGQREKLKTKSRLTKSINKIKTGADFAVKTADEVL